MESKVLLSISIAVSEHSDKIQKCLDSLQSLQNNISSELILTDKGCDADLNSARGEWILYMGSDEWFESTGEIECFFKSGEYRGYTSASCVIRNYAFSNGSMWWDAAEVRMARRDGGFLPGSLQGSVKMLVNRIHHPASAMAEGKLSEVLRGGQVNQWEKALERWIGREIDETLYDEFAAQRDEGNIYHNILCNLTFTAWLNRLAGDGEDLAALHALLQDYVNDIKRLYTQIYSPSVLQDYTELAGEEYLAALHVHDALAAVETGDYKSALEEVLEAVRAKSPIYMVLNRYAALLKQSMEERNRQEQDPRKELERMGDLLKDKIRLLIQQDALDAAGALIAELEKLLPGDRELDELHRCIYYHGLTQKYPMGGKA